MIDNTCGFKRISFMDGFSGYNQIKIYLDDEKHTSFWTPLGVFCYTIISFGLKNAGAIYQRAMSTTFRDHLRKIVECYVDDIAIKSRDKNNHLHDLRILMRAHLLKINPTKYFLGASSLDSLSQPKKFILIPTRSKPSKICSLQRTLKNLGIYNADWLT